MVGVWATNPLYSYGFVVPLISAYILFAKLDRLRALRQAPDYWLGVSTSVLGLAMLVIGRLGSIRTVEEGSLIIALAGLVLLLFGRETLRVVAFPLLYLMVSFPIWDRVIEGLQVRSQVLSGMIAITMLHSVGVPAFRDGTMLVLPNVTLDILRACSGVNQLIAVVAMCLPAAYLWLTGTLRRVALLTFAVTVAYLSNGFRIAMVGFLDYKELARGDIRGLHLLEGLATSVLGYVLVFACLSLLSLGMRRPDVAAQQMLAAPGSPRHSRKHGWLDAGVLGIAIFVGVLLTAFRPGHVALNRAFNTFPTQLGSWTQALSTVNTTAYHLNGADDELDRMYLRSSGERVRLYVGYQRHEEQGKEVANATSWELTRTASPVEVRIDSEAVRLNEVVEVNGDTRTVKLFWFDFGGRPATNWYVAKAYTIWNALTRGRTNGAIVLVEWEAPATSDLEASRRNVMDFVKLLRPQLAEYIPS
jgi:EpsI family protein